jgi:hypothetical protein
MTAILFAFMFVQYYEFEFGLRQIYTYVISNITPHHKVTVLTSAGDRGKRPVRRPGYNTPRKETPIPYSVWPNVEMTTVLSPPMQIIVRYPSRKFRRWYESACTLLWLCVTTELCQKGFVEVIYGIVIHTISQLHNIRRQQSPCSRYAYIAAGWHVSQIIYEYPC